MQTTCQTRPHERILANPRDRRARSSLADRIRPRQEDATATRLSGFSPTCRGRDLAVGAEKCRTPAYGRPKVPLRPRCHEAHLADLFYDRVAIRESRSSAFRKDPGGAAPWTPERTLPTSRWPFSPAKAAACAATSRSWWQKPYVIDCHPNAWCGSNSTTHPPRALRNAHSFVASRAQRFWKAAPFSAPRECCTISCPTWTWR